MDQHNQKTEESSDGALLGAIVVIALIVIGGAYLIETNLAEIKQRNNTANALFSQDDLGSIEADLNKNSNIGEIGNDLK